MKKPSAIELYTNEALQVHALCDRAGVSKGHQDGNFSMAQRVNILVGMYENIRQNAGLPPVVVGQ